MSEKDPTYYEDLTVEEQVLYLELLYYASNKDDIVLSVFKYPNLLDFMTRNIEKIKQIVKDIQND